MKSVSYVSYREDSEALVVGLSEDHVFLTNLPYQPRVADHVVFKRVPRDFHCPGGECLKAYYDALRSSLGLERALVFLTAADVRKHLRRELPDGSAVIATVGLEPPVCPGSSRSGVGRLGSTVNVAVLANAALSESGLVDLLKTVCEAKSLAMAELLLRCELRSPGTASDAVAVGRPAGLEGSEHFAGMATSLGNAVASGVYEGLVSLGLELLGLEGYVRNLLGLSLEQIVESAMRVYGEAPIPGLEPAVVEEYLRKLVRSLLGDPNVLSIVVAARELDLHASAGSIPGLPVEDFRADSVGIVADELLASALALYISGFKGLLATYWVERLKKRGLTGSELPVFEDDVLSALIGSAIAKLCEEFGC